MLIPSAKWRSYLEIHFHVGCLNMVSASHSESLLDVSSQQLLSKHACLFYKAILPCFVVPYELFFMILERVLLLRLRKDLEPRFP